MILYSNLRKYIGVEKLNGNTDEVAYLTHYLHNQKIKGFRTYKSKAKKYYDDKVKNSLVNEPEFQYIIPIQWDIPFPSPKKPKFTFIDLFAGIGGFRMALQKNGGRCIFSSEIDKAAKQTYERNYGEVPFGDIRQFTSEEINNQKLDKLIPNHDVLAAGFPCQPFSLAGVSARNYLGQQHGFEDSNQGNLFFDILRIINIKKPKVLFLENVKNLKSHDKGKTFKTIEKLIKAEGYSFDSKIINSETEVPQRRQRTYMICFRIEDFKFQFPEFNGEPRKLREILEENVQEEFTISDKLWEGHQRRSKRNKERGTGFTVSVANIDKPSNTIVARYYKDGKECLIPQLNKNPRKLTPRECARLQGYPEDFVLPDSKSAAYRQFGNSVSVPVINKLSESIVKNMKENGLL